eukprot:2973551-Karenia_brevis.AAC.1
MQGWKSNDYFCGFGINPLTEEMHERYRTVDVPTLAPERERRAVDNAPSSGIRTNGRSAYMDSDIPPTIPLPRLAQ